VVLFDQATFCPAKLLFAGIIAERFTACQFSSKIEEVCPKERINQKSANAHESMAF
jgi:hypothetical protein